MYYIVFAHQGIGHISATKCLIEMGLRSKCSIYLYGQVTCIEKSTVNIVDMRLITRDHVTYVLIIITSLIHAFCLLVNSGQLKVHTDYVRKGTDLHIINILRYCSPQTL